MVARLALFTGVLVLVAGMALAASQAARLDSYRLLDRHGERGGIFPSAKSTLVYFYRGDW